MSSDVVSGDSDLGRYSQQLVSKVMTYELESWVWYVLDLRSITGILEIKEEQKVMNTRYNHSY